MPSFSSASRTSSTLFGRTILLINFIAASKHALQVGAERVLGRLRELRSALCNVKHVNRLLSLCRNQHEVDVAAPMRDETADPIQKAQSIVGVDFEDGVPTRRLIVEMHYGRKPGGRLVQDALLAPAQPLGD